jgi:3-isopropylmalate/(R)-2-methylmalate dehydratase small subunit
MFLEGLDMVGATLAMQEQIQAFQQGHWAARPWLKDVAHVTKARLASSTAQR